MADVLTLRDIPDDFGESYLCKETTLRQRQQARRYANESYVSSVKLFRNDAEIQVNARVFRSQRKNEDCHRVWFSVAKEQITDAVCSCKAGVSGECAHLLAVVMKITDWILQGLSDIPSQPACTSVPQQWDKPRGGKILPEPVSTMVIARPGNTIRKKRPLIAEFIDNRKIQLLDSDIVHLQSLSGTPLSYLACKPFETVATDHGPQNVGGSLAHQIPLMQPIDGPFDASIPCGDLTFPKEPVMDMSSTLTQKQLDLVSVTQSEAILLEQNTREQSSCEKWHAERAKRITASNFGRFMTRKAAITQKFVDSIMKPKPFKSAATSYGVATEKVARNMYRKKKKCHVHDCGLVINPKFPFLGATPDGKVCDNGNVGILEIKCPFSIRDLTLATALETNGIRQKLFLENVGENIVAKKTHPYWFQVHGQLMVTGATFCDLVTYTRQDFHVLRILPDVIQMESILNKFITVFKEFMDKEQ